MSRIRFLIAFLGLSVCLLPGKVHFGQDPNPQPDMPPAKNSEGKETEAKWLPLLKPDSLDGWKSTNFGGEGSVEVAEGVLHLGRGEPLTGITIDRKDFPVENFELRWTATRVEGSDFFAGVTFPVGKEHCTFICGGWGGGLVGLSSIDGNDASENETSSFKSFKNGKPYQFRIRVDKTHITAWIDDEEVVHAARAERRFSLRGEVRASRPLGYCVFRSVVDVKDWEYRVIE